MLTNFALILAEAEVPAEAPASPWMGYIQVGVIALICVGFYFFMIRPQKTKEKKDVAMRNAIEIGDEVVTIGGIIGIVMSIKDDTVVVETGSDRSKIRVKKWSIQSNLTEH